MSKIRIMIIDEHPAVRRALKIRLDSVPEIDVVAVAEGMIEGRQMAQDTKPQVVLLGLKSFIDHALIITQTIAHLNELGCAVLILTPYPDDMEQEMFLRAGASGYLLKDINSPQLIASIRQAIPSSEVHFNG